ncbi:MAG: hypothetical protein AAFO99_00635 [Bacteroidota bacterium]
MQYLSREIEALSKRKKQASLVKKHHSCGIFQDYGRLEAKADRKEEQKGE